MSGPTLADRLFRPGFGTDLVLITTGAAFTAITAQIQVPLWPVPLTGQTLAVLLVGAFLGALRGALSLSLYALIGVLGLPVFAGGASGVEAIAGRSGGFIIGFIAAAAVVGWIAQRTRDHRLSNAILSFLVGTVVAFAVGLPWLAFVLGMDPWETLEVGLSPYVLPALIKMLVAAGIVTYTWRWLERQDRLAADADLIAVRSG